MKKHFTLSILIVISTILSAQTQVSGNQSGIWTAENSPYEVIGEVTIPAGALLTIEAGVEVNFQGYYQFRVEGDLQAIGTENNMIRFTTDNPGVGWGGIRVSSSNIIELSYCRIEFGKSAATDYPDFHGGAIALLSSNAIITNCVFADNDATGGEYGSGGAIYAINTGGSSALTQIIDCKFIRNHCYGEGGAIKFTNDWNTEITGCEFIENTCFYGGGAISFYSVLDTKMTKCLFVNNRTSYSNGGAIHMLGIGNMMSFTNCTFSGNEAGSGDAGGIYVVNGSATFDNCIIYDNPGTYSDDLYVGFGASATVNYSNLTMPDDATGSNNIEGDPLFVDADNDDFRLQETSPCIDAGTEVGLPFAGVAPDMGCYEYGETMGTDEPAFGLSVYPNPSNGIFTFETLQSFNQQVTIEITDITGKIIYTSPFETNENQRIIDISAQISGAYFLKVYDKTNREIYLKKVVVY